MKAANLLSRRLFGKSQQYVRFRSDKPAFQSNEYPWATEPPVITKITASQAAAGKPAISVPVKQTSSSLFGNLFSSIKQQVAPSPQKEDKGTKEDKKSSSSHTSVLDWMKHRLGLFEDPFDDTNSLTDEQREHILQAQRESLPTTVVSEPITKQEPAYMAAATHPDASQRPETLITTLDNGLRVVSLDIPGSPVASLGMISQLASRTEARLGTTQMLELLSFGPTKKYPMGVGEVIQEWGSGQPFGTAGREQSLHCLDAWQPFLEDAVEALGGMASEPIFNPELIQHGLQALQYQTKPEHIPIELLLNEAIHEAAFGKDQQLGKRHFCTEPEKLLDMQPQMLLDHWQKHITHNPAGVVLGCAGTKHDSFVKMVEQHFGGLKQQSSPGVINSTYKGSECKIPVPKSPIDPESDVGKEKGLTRVAVVWPTGGWHDDDFVTACVLQSLLGGGSSFSAGGPGKGMYSRLYRTILNQYHWAESAEAMTVFYNEAGLMGIQGSCAPRYARDMVKLFCQHFHWLANKPVDPEELLRAKNMLRCNVLIQLESRLVMFEDIGRQVLTYGRHESMGVTAARIEAVTAADLQDLAARMMQNPPSLASAGVDLSEVPSHEEMCGWLK